MLKLVPLFAILSVAAAPAVAQAPSTQPAPAQVKTVKKKVCQRVNEERSTGSLLGSTTKVCKTVEVPADKPLEGSTTAENPKAR
jgi:hypothetical protein